jgi:hypothetical protein
MPARVPPESIHHRVDEQHGRGDFRSEPRCDPLRGMHDEQDRIPPPAKRQVSNIELRRAVMRILIRANGAMLVGEIVRRLEDVDHVDVAAARVATPSQRVSNLLGWQVRRGRVKRISHGLYVAVPESIPRTTLWRIEHWDDLGWGGRR